MLFINFGIGRHRSQNPRAPVANFVSLNCTICHTKQDTEVTDVDIKNRRLSIPIIVQKTLQSQEKNQGNSSTPSDGDGRLPVPVTLDAHNQGKQEVITQQLEGDRDGRPRVPAVNVSCPDDENQDEILNDIEDVHLDIQDEQQENSLLPASSSEINTLSLAGYHKYPKRMEMENITTPDETPFESFYSAVNKMTAISKANLNDDPIEEVEMDQTVGTVESAIIPEKLRHNNPDR
ncbi:hypothetical protein JTB14_037482 [Gonioctena quinquepunctata]|nr:hypothetical protein JTB14_037482 [Gonioctena quinquepunctata]